MGNCELRMANGELRIADCGWRMANWEWRIANCELGIGDLESDQRWTAVDLASRRVFTRPFTWTARRWNMTLLLR